MTRNFSVFIFFVSLYASPVVQADALKSPLSPADALSHFQLAPGFRIELVAAEPQVVDPIEIRFDARGRLWVVEMRDYPNAGAEGEVPVSRVRLLHDRDGDGLFEGAETFADGLCFATGLQPWRDGVFVTVSGQLLYLKDTNDDGKADLREVWYRGFAEENSQLRANHPRLGLDNRIFISGGLQGGKIVDARLPGAAVVSIDGRDFCFDPLTGKCEAVSGRGQYGLTFDSFGNRFVCSNRNPAVHVVLEERFVRRNPLFAPPAVVQDVAKPGESSRVFPLSGAWTTSILHAHQFTAACGLLVYRDDALGSELRGNVFVCEPTGNLVHREVLSSEGVSFRSRPAREGVEFLATADEWCRPVNLTVGPSGELYVVDMYRAVIEHPHWLPPEEKDRSDFRHGERHGRIYRIVRDVKEKRNGARVPIDLESKTSPELVALLGHDRAWWRDTAARLLLERQDRGVQKLLEKLVRTDESVLTRIQSLWTLSGLGVLDIETLLVALGNGHARLREQALRLSEPRLARSSRLRERVFELARDVDGRVRFQVALSLGGLPDGASADVLARLAMDDSRDPWMRRGVGTMLPKQVFPVLLRILTLARGSNLDESDGRRELVRELAAVVGAGQSDAEIQGVLEELVTLRIDLNSGLLQGAGLVGLAEGSARGGSSLQAFLGRMTGDLTRAVQEVFVRNAKTAVDRDLASSMRYQAVRVLSHAPTDVALDTLLQLASDESDPSLSMRAIDSLAVHRSPRIGPVLLREFSSRTPETRRRILDVLLASADRALYLLSEMEAGRLARTEVDLARAQRLLEHGDPAIRERSQTLLGAVRTDRDEIVRSYRASLDLEGVPARGKEIFVKRCATCHKIDDVGVDVGPQIEDSREKTREQLFIDILDPNRAIDARYLSYSAVTRSGDVYAGIVTSETGSSVTIRQPEAKTVTLLRQELLQLRASGRSLMPEGLEQDLSRQDLADLLDYIKMWRYQNSGQ